MYIDDLWDTGDPNPFQYILLQSLKENSIKRLLRGRWFLILYTVNTNTYLRGSPSVGNRVFIGKG